MKNFKFLGVLAIVLPLLFAFTGCSSSDPDSLTFANTDVEFKIDENLDFFVRFLKDTSVDFGMGPLPIKKDVTINGSILSAVKWDAPVIEGEVSDIKTSDTTFKPYIPKAIGQAIELTYVYNAEDVITQIKVDFPLPENYATFAGLAYGLDPEDDGDMVQIIGYLVATEFLEMADLADEVKVAAVVEGVYTYLGFNQACNLLMKGTYNIK